MDALYVLRNRIEAYGLTEENLVSFKETMPEYAQEKLENTAVNIINANIVSTFEKEFNLQL